MIYVRNIRNAGVAHDKLYTEPDLNICRINPFGKHKLTVCIYQFTVQLLVSNKHVPYIFHYSLSTLIH